MLSFREGGGGGEEPRAEYESRSVGRDSSPTLTTAIF